MASTLETLHDRHDRHDELVAAGEVIDLRFPAGQKTLSARASKLFHLLVKTAGEEVAADRLHRVPIAWLRSTGLGHLTIDEFVACIRELASITIDVEVRDEAGRAPHVKTGAFLAHIERDIDAARGELLYEFSRTMRYIFARSAYWAVLDRRATMAFESRYAIRLYELMSLRAGLTRKLEERFTLDELRARLGVPDGKLTRWVHLRQKALDPAVAEVNHLSPFRVRWAPIKHGRSVAAVQFTWERKNAAGRAGAREELAGSREGRVGRRKGAVDAQGETGGEVDARVSPLRPVPVAFPETGSIRYGRWAPLVRTYAPTPTPDVDLVADKFREFARSRNMPLNAKGIERMFVSYCAKFQVR